MANKLTGETMLSLPRPGAAVPNGSGTYYIMPYSRFDFNTGRTTRNVAIGKLDSHSLASARDHSLPVVNLLTDLRYPEAVWLDDHTVIYLRPIGSVAGEADVDTALSDKAFKAKLAKDENNNKVGQEIWFKTIEGVNEKLSEVPVPISDFKTVQISNLQAILTFSAEVYPENPSLDAVAHLDVEYEEKKEGADYMGFDQLFMRHWDTWTTKKKKLVFYVELKRMTGTVKCVHQNTRSQSLHNVDDGCQDCVNEMEAKTGSWSVISSPLSLLANLPNIECPSGPHGDKHDYDLSSRHLVFVAKDPNLPPAWHTRMHVYLVPLYPQNQNDRIPKCLTSQGGARSSPVFSASAKAQRSSKHEHETAVGKIAWLEMRKDGYEADRNRIIIYDLQKDRKYGISETWDASPVSVRWGKDDKTLYAAAEDKGHLKLWQLTVPETPESHGIKSIFVKPCQLTKSDTVSSYSVLPSKSTASSSTSENTSHTPLLVTLNSFRSPNEAFVLEVSNKAKDQLSLCRISSISSDLVGSLDIRREEEFWFPGASPDRQVHGFILKPHGYRKDHKYGLAFLVHKAHGDLRGIFGVLPKEYAKLIKIFRHTRWNANVFAAQGYVVVLINFTGSTGYGQDFTDAIAGDWGGKPYKDLVAGLEYVKSVYKDMIDEERMVMLGGSYGGFMANYMQGHNDITKFKAFVCHDGVFDMKHLWYTTDELHFLEQEFGGTPWDVPAEYDKWSPHKWVSNWKTPHLIIHGGSDYRVPETEGIAPFQALQRKGIPSRFVYFPKENHWVLNPFNSRRWHNEIFDWMEKWVGSGPSAQ